MTPSTPSRILAAAISIAAIDVFWSGLGLDTTYYLLERHTGTNAFVQIASLPIYQTVYHDSGLASSTQYHYRVRGYNGSTYGSYSPEIDAWTLGDLGGVSDMIDAAILEHEAEDDPHPGYLTQAEADYLYDPLGAGGGVEFNDAEGDPTDVDLDTADGVSEFAARRDHEHAIAESIVPTWTGPHTFKDQYVTAIGDGISTGYLDFHFSDTLMPTMAGSRARNTMADPHPVQANDVLSRITGTGFGDTDFPAFSSGRIDITADETHSDSVHGTRIDFLTTPKGTNTPAAHSRINDVGQITNDLPIGTPPLVVTSTTVITNLNADLLDGNHADDFADVYHTHDGGPELGGEYIFLKEITDTFNLISHYEDLVGVNADNTNAGLLYMTVVDNGFFTPDYQILIWKDSACTIQVGHSDWVPEGGDQATTITAEGVYGLSGTLNLHATRNTDGDDPVIAKWVLAAGGGNVIGPVSSVDDHLVTFDGETGKIIQDSGSVVTDFATSGHTHGVAGSTGQIQIGIHGGKYTPQAGVLLDFEVPHDLTIVDWTLVADTAGSIVVDLWRDTYANFPPTDADSQTGATPPTLTSEIKHTSSSLGDWTVNWNAGDWVRLNIDSADTLTRVTLILSYTRR